MLKNILKKIVDDVWHREFNHNARNIKKDFQYIFKETKKNSFKVLDVGCGQGRLVKDILGNFSLNFSVYGIEVDKKAAKEALKRGIKVKVANLENPFPFADGIFDIIHGDQVIEHILNKDRFLLNCRKKLNKDGYLIISTENLSSVENIIALLLGYEPFSQTLSMRCHLGNPLSPHFGEKYKNERINELYGHKMICSYLGLRQLLEYNGFKVVRCSGAGFFPFPGILSKLNPRHARFITILAQKN
jgi:SAM-dependent methyltransferase